MKKLFFILTAALVVALVTIFLLAQSVGGNILEPATTQSTTQLNTQTEKVSLLNERLSATRNQVTDLERQSKALSTEIPLLQANETSLTTQIEELTNELQALPPNSTSEEEILEAQITDLNETLLTTKTELTAARADQNAAAEALETARQDVQSIQTELTEEQVILQDEVVLFAIGVARYLVIILVYWIIYQIYRLLLNRYLENEQFKDILTLIGTLITIVATVVTLLIAFIGNLALLVTSFGVFSAALVVALQDLVSSFFAWVLIKARGPYKHNDTIEIPFQGATVTGVVRMVGFLRTELQERVGGDSLDREEATGKTIFFPNNLILKQSFRNLTYENRILWHRMDIVITFESDFNLARHVVEEGMKRVYNYMVDHKDVYLDDVFNVKTIYQPKVYLSIASNGVRLTVWYAVRAGSLRDVVERISREVLHEFNVHGIDLAYPTTRVIPTADEKFVDRPARFLEPGIDM